MSYVIEVVGLGFYKNLNNQPRWVDQVGDAKVFRDLRTAHGTVKLLRRRGIPPATIVDYEVARGNRRPAAPTNGGGHV